MSLSEPLYIFQVKNRTLIGLWVITIVFGGLLGFAAVLTTTGDISDMVRVVFYVPVIALIAYSAIRTTLNRRRMQIEFYDNFVRLYPKWQKEGLDAQYSDVNINWKVLRNGVHRGTLTLKNDTAEKPQKWNIIDLNGKTTGKPLSLWLQSKLESGSVNQGKFEPTTTFS